MNPSPDFSSQTVLVVGLAREGQVAARWLAQHGAQVLASDVRSPHETLRSDLTALGVQWAIGPQAPTLLNGVDAVVVSPGVPQDIPLLQAARARRLPISAEPRLFAQACPAPLIGITGSSGKTTTTTLVARMLEAAGSRTWLGGNIGAPLLPSLEQIQPDDRAVMELSSFQLLYWDATPAWTAAPAPWHSGAPISPHVAAILNLTPNHLDRHPSMAHYIAAKANILAAQQEQDIAVLNREDAITGAWIRARAVNIESGPGQPARQFPLRSQLITFGFAKPASGDATWLEDDRLLLRRHGHTETVLTRADIHLRGRHNLANVLAAMAIASAAGAPPAAMRAAVQTFHGVPHRLEEVTRRNGVLWINDSIATAPERAVAALRSFDAPIILLAGGRDKHLPWDAWAREAQQRARIVIAFGEAIPLIRQALAASEPTSGRLQGVLSAPDLPAAVALAAQHAQPGEVVLLSPGGTSFDAYSDFAARGQHFRQLVSALNQA